MKHTAMKSRRKLILSGENEKAVSRIPLATTKNIIPKKTSRTDTDRQNKRMAMFKAKPARKSKADIRLEAPKYRTNRRFELLMKFRYEQN